MIIQLITPLMIATTPMQIQDVEPLKYNHTTQTATQGEFTTAQRMTTWNGTQTFDYRGRPSDSDND